MHKGHITYQITVFHSIYISRQIYKYTKMDLPDFLKVAIPLVVAPVGGALLFKHHFAGHNNAKRLLTFKNLDECVDELEKIQQASSIDIESDWTLYQNLIHCAQSIEYSMYGFPQNKSVLFQKTLGKLVLNQFEKQGYMRHNRNEPIPGATPIEPNGNAVEAVTRLQKAITDFDQFDQPLKPHFAYGALTKSQFANAHCMHCADHFAMMTY